MRGTFVKIVVAIPSLGSAWHPERTKVRFSIVNIRGRFWDAIESTQPMLSSRARTHFGRTIANVSCKRGGVLARVFGFAAFQGIAIHHKDAANIEVCLCEGRPPWQARSRSQVHRTLQGATKRLGHQHFHLGFWQERRFSVTFMLKGSI